MGISSLPKMQARFGLRKTDFQLICLYVLLFMAITNMVLILGSVVSPWYKLIEFDSTSESWNCYFVIERSAFYSWKGCQCDQMGYHAGFLPPQWCTTGFYDWRECISCNTLGCAWFVFDS